MRVEPNSNVPEANVHATKAKPPVTASAELDAADFSASTQLTEALDKVPITRADKVAAAKALVQDPNYPNEATLAKVAGVLADHIKPSEPV